MAITALVAGSTANARSDRVLIPSHKKLTLKQTIHWQHKIIRHDRWVIRTAKSHHPRVVKWHKAQLKWTSKELKESLKAFHSLQRSYSVRSGSSTSSSWLVGAFSCIHKYEGSWSSNTGNGYYGGLQMDLDFMKKYGSSLLTSKGTADNWSPSEQIGVAIVAYNSGRGFGPWPNTRKSCHL